MPSDSDISVSDVRCSKGEKKKDKEAKKDKIPKKEKKAKKDKRVRSRSPDRRKARRHHDRRSRSPSSSSSSDDDKDKRKSRRSPPPRPKRSDKEVLSPVKPAPPEATKTLFTLKPVADYSVAPVVTTPSLAKGEHLCDLCEIIATKKRTTDWLPRQMWLPGVSGHPLYDLMYQNSIDFSAMANVAYKTLDGPSEDLTPPTRTWELDLTPLYEAVVDAELAHMYLVTLRNAVLTPAIIIKEQLNSYQLYENGKKGANMASKWGYLAWDMIEMWNSLWSDVMSFHQSLRTRATWLRYKHEVDSFISLQFSDAATHLSDTTDDRQDHIDEWWNPKTMAVLPFHFSFAVQRTF